MSVFGDIYSEYYDLIYEEKDYQKEVDFVDMIIKRYNPSAKTILDLGCGTGRHSVLLAERGYDVYGVDQSTDMLIKAEECKKTVGDVQLHYICSDICDLTLNKKFDVVISLFHVFSYLNTNFELDQAFKTTTDHLTDNGIFLFDCWYGPAVLSVKPEVRMKTFENERIVATRIATPDMLPNENRVDVKYKIFIVEKTSKILTELGEVHGMRYLFKPEIEQLLERNQMILETGFEFLSEAPLSLETWNGCFVGRKL